MGMVTDGDAGSDVVRSRSLGRGDEWAALPGRWGGEQSRMLNESLARLDDSAKRAIDIAEAAALSEGRQEVGTEHLLMGVIEEGLNKGVRALISNGVSLSALSRHLKAEVSATASQADHRARVPRLNTHACSALTLARQEAHQLEEDRIGAEHLLLGVVGEGEGTGAVVLQGFGIDSETLRSHLRIVRDTSVGSESDRTGSELQTRAASRSEGGPRERRMVRNSLFWFLRTSTSLLAFAVLMAMWLGLVGLVDVLADRVTIGGALEGRPWVLGWLLFVLLLVGATCLYRWPNIRWILNRRSLAMLREEYLDLDVEDPDSDELNRIDYTKQAVVINFENTMARWAQRVRRYSLLILGVCIWTIVTFQWTVQSVVWGLASVGVMYAAHSVGQRFTGVGPWMFRYASKSSRVIPGLTQGLHSGMSAFVGVVLQLPAAVPVIMLVAQTPWWRELTSGDLSAIANALLAITGAVSEAPAFAAALLFVLPIGLVIIVYRLTEPGLAVDAEEWLLPDDVRPALYLRTWPTDEIPIRLRSGGGRFIDAVLPSKRSSFTESVGRNLSLIAPVVLVGEPGTGRHHGVGSMWSTDDQWRALVEAHAERASFTVFAASEVPPDSGFSWEIELVGSGRSTGRVLIIIPPGFDFAKSFEPGGYFALACAHPVFSGLKEAQPTERTLMMVRGSDATWECFDASAKDDLVYAYCMMLMTVEYFSYWEEGALGRSLYPSTLSAQRYAVMIVSGLGWNPTMLVKLIAIVYPPIRAILIAIDRFLLRRADQRPLKEGESPAPQGESAS